MAGGQNVTIRAPKAASIRAMTSAYGRVIPLIYGKGRVQANVIYYTDFKATEHKSKQNSGGKGGSGGSTTTINYSYTVCALMALAEGVANASLGTVWLGKNKGSAADFGLSYFNGSTTQAPLGYVTTNHPSEALGYRNTVYVGAAKFELGNDASMPSVNAEVIGRSSGVNVGLSSNGDANIADIIYDLIVDSTACLGLPAALLGDLSALRTYAQAAELFVSPVYAEAKPAREMIASLCNIANVGVYFSEGVAKFVPFGDMAITANGTTFTPNLTPVYALTEDDFISDGEETVRVIRKAQADAYNHVKVTYQNRSNDYNDDVVDAKDQASIELNGLRTMSEVALPEIADTAAARRVAQQILQRAINIRNTYEFNVGWAFSRLEPMDIVTLTESGLGLNAEPVRIIEIEETEDGFFVRAEEMQVGSLGAAKYTSQVSNGYKTDYNISAGNSNAPVIFEPPTSLSNTPQLWIATSGAESWGGCNVWVSDDNATYKQVGVINGSARHGMLTAALASGAALDTTNNLAVDLSISAGSLSAGTTQNATDLTTLCYVNGELLSYRDAALTGPNAYTLGYLVRGAYGTAIAAHASGTKFARLDATVFRYDYDPKFLGRTIYIKLQAFNVYGSAVQDISTVTPHTYTFAGAPIATVTGLALEQPFTGDSVKLKWNATDGAVTYTVQVKNAAGTILYRTVTVNGARFEYTWQDSLADGGPYRSLQIGVRANSENGSSGAFTLLSVANPVPSALAGLQLTGGFGVVFFEWTASAEPDLAGYQVWMSATSGFTPGAGNLIYDGTDNKINTRTLNGGTAITAGTTYYFRVAAYDKFGKAGLNVSSELSTTALTIVSGINSGDITGTMVAAGALDMTKFASGIRPPRVVTTLPTIDGSTYKNQDTVVLTTDGKLYRAVSGSWSRATDGADITANSITAGKIAAGAIGTTELAANSITADKLFVQSIGAAMNRDPNCADGTAWSGTGMSFTTVSDGAVGTTVMRGAPTSNAFDSKFLPIDKTKVYRVRFWARRSGTANGIIYAGVVLLDAAANNIESPIGSFWYIAAVGATPGTTWTKYEGYIGSGQTQTFPSNAVSMSPVVLLNYGGSTGYHEVQDFRLEEVIGGTLIQDGAITTNKMTAGSINADRLAANSITSSLIAANTITAGQIAAGTITGTEIAASAITTSKIAAGAVTANELAASSVTASKIQAGTITTDRLVANAATAAANSNSAFTNTVMASSSFWSRTDDVLTFASTGAPVTFHGVAGIQLGNSVATNQSLLSSIDSVFISVDLFIDGVYKRSSVIEQKTVALSGSSPAGGRKVIVSLPLLWRETLSAGSHTFSIRTEVYLMNSSGSSTNTSGLFAVSAMSLAQENKV